MTNSRNTVLYTGVTNDLVKRVGQHKSRINKGFTYKYNLDRLVYYEKYRDIEDAITREKQIKAGSRSKKNGLIDSINLKWKDLYNEIT